MSGTKMHGQPLVRGWLLLLGAVILAAGLFFAIGGGKLVSLGGSPYFLIAGIALVLAGGLIALRKTSGGLLFGATFLFTIFWALWEVGFSFWPLISRLLAMGVGATVVALSYPLLRRGDGSAPAWRPALLMAVLVGLGSAAGAAGMFMVHPTVPFAGQVASLVPVDPAREQKDWTAYGNTPGGSRFVALDQITRDNVNKLKVAWTYRTGDIAQSDGNGAEDQNTPLQVGDTLFICTPHNNVIALDADTGREKWKTLINAKASVWMRCRGLAYFDVHAPIQQPSLPGATPVTAVTVPTGAACQRRILMNTINAELIALDADTGKYCADFGTNGRVDLKAGLGDAPDPQYQLTSAPTLAGTTVVVGGRVADNVQVDMPGGVMRGFDVISGKLRWAFDPGNPAITGAPAAGKTYARSTPNVWAAMSYDPASNTVFMPVGSASVDLYGVTRSALDHTYGASMLALDATTGREKWHFQTVHNDLWDFDLPMQPSFVDFPVDAARKVPALVFGTKAGQVYVLDRATGKPLTDVKEVPVKPANIPGEPYSPTQPKSLGMPQIGVGPLTEAVNTGMGSVPLKGTPYSVVKDRFLSALGIPCQAPPYGTLTAIDLKSRAIKWQVPVGTVRDTGPMGIRMGLPIPIGMPTLGGTLATQGGLVFIAGTQDFYLRAFNAATGAEVWKARLPVGSQGGPMSYKSPKSGKQYVVVTAGGARQSPDRGDYVIAYTLR